MKTAAIIILYHPTAQFIENMLSYYDEVERIFVYDNSESESGIKTALSQYPKVVFHQDFINEGISKRLNMGCEAALEENFDWVLTMDQDSKFSAKTAGYFLHCCRVYPTLNSVALFGCGYGRENIVSTPDCAPEKIGEMITSGMVLSLQKFSVIGPFDEALFIDSVDHEFCIRAQLSNFDIVRFNNIYLQHEVGDEVNRGSVKSLFLIKKKKIIHSSLRCYYMYRNMLYLEEKYKKSHPPFAKIIREFVITHMKICFLYGRDSIKLFKYIQKAKADYAHQKMGRIDAVIP